MKRNNNFFLTQFDNVYYLVPTGQAAADHKRTITINEVGAFVWNSLEKEVTLEHLIKLVVFKYAESGEDISKLTQDISAFVNALKAKGLVEDLSAQNFASSVGDFTIKIAGIKFNFHSGVDIIHDSFKAFLCNGDSTADIDVIIKLGRPNKTTNGFVLVRTADVLIMDAGDKYILIYPSMEHVKEVHISKELNEVIVFVLPPFAEKAKEEIFLSLRTPFLMKALTNKMIMLHSASILYKDRVYCFSAPAGTGKSTHTALWKSLYDVEMINGDLNLLAPSEEKTYVYGTPWCGTSKTFSPKVHTLGGIIFLKQAKENVAVQLEKTEAYPKLISRIITPAFDKKLANEIFDCSSQVLKNTAAFSLNCKPDNEAVCEIKKLIDLTHEHP